MADEANYWQLGELEDVRACPACGAAESSLRYSGLKDMEEGVPGEWSMKHCIRCDSLYMDPRPALDAIGKAYARYYTHESPLDENRVVEGGGVVRTFLRRYLRERFGFRGTPGLGMASIAIQPALPLRLQLDYFMRHLPPVPGRLLDVGCGNGAFMVRAREAGWDVEGVEPDAIARGVALRSTGASVHAAIGDIADSSFDQVTLAHVIEHLHDPAGMLESCRRVLRPGGRLWIATPNISGIGHRHFGSHWQPLETPRHLVMPSAEALSEMVRGAGFARVRLLRRGRGASKRVAASAGREGRKALGGIPPLLLGAAIDLAATISTRWAEELVLVATRES